MKNKKRIYTFGNGSAEGNAQMRDLLGGKGTNLAAVSYTHLTLPTICSV